MPQNPFDPRLVEASLGGRYAITKELRVGGQGAVFKATRDPGKSSSRDVALKLHLDPKQDVRVEREIKAMTGMSHPALSQLIEHGLCDVAGTKTRYIAWEYIDGDPLDTALSKGPLDESSVTRMAADVCSAVAAIWQKRIVHRDINPKNIMLKYGGGAVLIDLGGARHLDETSVTAIGSTFGTPGYLSPEQYRAERALTSASDIFSLGVVLEQSLSGKHPTLFDQHRIVSAPPSCSTVAPHTTAELAAVIDRMLSIRAAFRPQIEELVAFFSGQKRTT